MPAGMEGGLDCPLISQVIQSRMTGVTPVFAEAMGGE